MNTHFFIFICFKQDNTRTVFWQRSDPDFPEGVEITKENA